jgi:hypothetical protein
MKLDVCYKWSVFFLFSMCIVAGFHEREVIEGTTYTRIIRLDGRGDLIFDNDRIFRRQPGGLVCSYNVVDIREEGRKIDSPPCTAGPREVCGHILASHCMTYWDFCEQCGLRVSIFVSLIVTYYC